MNKSVVVVLATYMSESVASDSIVVRIKSAEVQDSSVNGNQRDKIKIHLTNFRERLVLEHNMVSHIKIECMFVLFIIFYVLSIYFSYSWPPTDKVAVPLASALVEATGYSKHFDFNRAVELVKEQGQHYENFNVYKEPFYFKDPTTAFPIKEFLDPAFVVLPSLLIRRQSLTSNCPNFSPDLQTALPKFGFCTKLGQTTCSVKTATFNLLNCLDPDVDPPAPALAESLFGSTTVYANSDSFGVLPWGKDSKKYDAVVAATPSQIVDVATTILGNVTLQAEISGIQLRTLLVFPAELDVVELFYLEFKQLVNGAISVRFYQEAMVNPESFDWLLLVALVGAVLDAIIQLRQAAVFPSKARNKEEREEVELEDDEEGEPRIALEKENFSAWNLTYDFILIGIAIFKMYNFRVNWISDRCEELIKLQGDTANPQAFMDAYDDLMNLLDWSWLLKRIEGVLLLLLVWRCIKLPSGHPRIASLARTLSIAWDELGHFLFLFVLVQIIFAVATLIAIGDADISVSSLTRLLVMQFGILGSQFPSKEELDRIGKARQAELTFLLAVDGVVSFFMMATFFLAIIVKAYADAEAELQRYVVVQQFPADVLSIGRVWLRSLRKGYPDKLRVIKALDVILHHKKFAKQSARSPRLSNNFHNDFGAFTDVETAAFIPVLDTSNITNAHAKREPPLTVSVMELSLVLAEDPADMIKYYLFLFGGLDWFKDSAEPKQLKVRKGTHPFLNPDFAGIDPEPALTLLQYAAKLEKALQDTLYPQMKRLAIARKEFARDMRNYEVASAEKVRNEREVKELKETFVATTGVKYQPPADSRRRRVVPQDDEITPFARLVAFLQESNIQTKLLIDRLKKQK